jgi:hypothetical protein
MKAKRQHFSIRGELKLILLRESQRLLELELG